MRLQKRDILSGLLVLALSISLGCSKRSEQGAAPQSQGASTQEKGTAPAPQAAGPEAAAVDTAKPVSEVQTQAQTMQIMMPVMFTFLSMTFPSGLALYWVVSNLITIAMQYYATGWGSLFKKGGKKTDAGRDKKLKKRVTEVEQVPQISAPGADITETGSTAASEVSDETGGDKREDGGGGYHTSSRNIKNRPGKGRNRHPKRR